MNRLKIHAANVQTTTIPNIFFDTYMPHANGEFLKVYLYLYRWSTDSSKELSIASIADTMTMTEGDVMRALKYWQNQNLLTLEEDASGNLLSLTLLPMTTSENKQPAVGSAQTLITETPSLIPAASSVKDFTKPNYTMNQISSFSKEHNGDQLFFVLQQYIGKPLSQTDINTIVFFHEKLGFSTDLIEYLFEYCVSNDHKSLHYMEKVAISWAEAGVDTVTKAKGRSVHYSKTYYAVLKAFGITGRGPAASEADYIKRWSDTYGFSAPLIIEACNKTMAATHSPSFEYTEKILKNWLKKKVNSLNDVKALDEAYEKQRKASEASKNVSAPKPNQNRLVKPQTTNRFHNFNQRVYDYSDIEQKLAKKLQTSSEN